MSIRGGLYLVDETRWNEALANLEQPAILARFVVSPGWVLGRPTWPTVTDRERWLKATHATEIPEGQLDNATRSRIATHDLM